MEVIIFIIIVAVLNSLSSKNKKKPQTQRKQTTVTRPERDTVTTTTMPKDAFAPKAQKPAKPAEPAKPASKKTLIEQEKGVCETKPMHLHEVTQAQMHAAAEGDDPCHKGGSGPVAARKIAAAKTVSMPQESPVYASPIYDDEDEKREQLREDFVRGIVMSEILMTPRQRQALRQAEAEGRI